ncbi:glycoside hydrolase family 75 protein [Streptomyces beihaiensis]|uniref:Glycoside hydrolase family 75 protein n=1 Tax=Streptomyces beihaiensis TaxID=2984495 RepID=A0ABT3TXC2_9ACTN|nr:glycoside hydrolase family 75 protein [Streptomyces beihaiensis]MCX3061698.1 glycoside hydrolase family 75 protein [Streptomyces beihaiensis]
MHPRLLPLAATGAAVLLAVASLPASARPRPHTADPGEPVVPVAREGGVRAADLLAAVRGCRQISHGRYRTDDGARATVPVCSDNGVVHFKADLDVDCDGRPGKHCNRRTDPLFVSTTAYQRSDGRELSAEELPYVVVPGASSIWSPARSKVTGGTVAAVVHRDRVVYAVVGDTGPNDLIGEASYATARALGINADPAGGGAGDEVTYILFPGVRAHPIESHQAAATAGERAAKALVARR